MRAAIPTLLLPLVLGACAGVVDPTAEDPTGDVTTPTVALTDLGRRTYLGFSGGLYADGNAMPPAHAAAGLERAQRIRPLDTAGNHDPNGRIVLMSLGMSNTTQEFCGSGTPTCPPNSFGGLFAADPSVERAHVTIVDAARGGQTADTWDEPADENYARTAQLLAARGLAPGQVQAVWLKVANAGPRTSLPASAADALRLTSQMADILRALRHHYPNLQQVYASSRTYGGFAASTLNPEPYAYESGFAVKWLVQAQIEQMRSGTIDAHTGDIGYDAAAPWFAR